jgi:hypothetical protein
MVPYWRRVVVGAKDECVESLELMQSVLENTWESLRPEQRARTTKTQVAVRILEMAATGERDPVRLRTEAVTGVATPEIR